MNKVAAPELSATTARTALEFGWTKSICALAPHIGMIYWGPALRDLKPLAFDHAPHLAAVLSCV